jgi:hypothetical protein
MTASDPKSKVWAGVHKWRNRWIDPPTTFEVYWLDRYDPRQSGWYWKSPEGFEHGPYLTSSEAHSVATNAAQRDEIAGYNGVELGPM